MKLHFLLMGIVASLLVLTACNEDDDSVTPDNPNRPVARAGNDTTIYTPFSTHYLNGKATTDPNNNIIHYQWKFLGGPSTSVYLNKIDPDKAFVTGLVSVGKYEFELTVRDSDNLTSKDTVIVTIAEPTCTAPNEEVILKELNWVYGWDIVIELNLFSHLPANSYFRNIYIKRDSSDEWETVMPYYNSPGNSRHTWTSYEGVIVIYGNQFPEEDTPDVKIEYCN